MGKFFIIGLGGGLGAILRYILSGLVQNWSKSISFPYGTLAVNLLGCLLIGLLTGLAETRGLFSPEARLFIFVGLLGGFTTFSTFGNETFNLILSRESFLAVLNLATHIVLGIGMVWAGRILAATLWR
ncbi:MAG: fluoride efflux transporter CrcB [Chloroflexi bacterium HGW-Chloroflexi-6]|nr:MAG: fluoride efflux transporter CrcB [Chloroflexi bacterium HGW-Chloroflexi-6]